MKKVLKVFSAFIAIIFLLAITLSAKAASPSPSPTPDPETVVEVNSFELFWPMVAGKTSADSLYSLKRLKENVRGLLIFSPARKGNYQVFLATKRLLEVEKLAKEGSRDQVEKTLSVAKRELEGAIKSINKAKEKDGLGVSKDELVSRLDNLETFLKWFKEKDGKDYADALEECLKLVQTATSKL